MRTAAVPAAAAAASLAATPPCAGETPARQPARTSAVRLVCQAHPSSRNGFITNSRSRARGCGRVSWRVRMRIAL